MAITTTCPGCNALFRLPEELAGKQVRCQKCARMFLVPGFAAVVEPVAAPPVEVAAPPPLPTEEVAAPQPEPAAEPVIVATEAAPEPAKPAPPPPPPAPEREPSTAWLAGMLAIFLVAMLTSGAFAAMWIYSDLAPPQRVTVVPPFRGTNVQNGAVKQFGFGGAMDQNLQFIPEAKVAVERRVAEPIDIAFGQNHSAVVQDRIEMAPPNVEPGRFGNHGAFRLYRIHLEQDKTYNFLVTSPHFSPRINLLERDLVVIDRFEFNQRKRTMFSYTPGMTGEYRIWIYTNDFVAEPNNSFTLFVSAVTAPPPQRIDVNKAEPIQSSLSVELPLDPNKVSHGPYREFIVHFEANKDYRIQVANDFYAPVVRIYDPRGSLFLRPDNVVQRKVDFTHTATVTGDYRIRISSQAYGTGPFQLIVTRNNKL